MKGKLIFKLGALSTILSVLLVVPALGQGNKDMGKQLKEYKAQMLKQLKLAPDKEKALLAVEDKYAAPRQEIIAGLKKSREDLQAALAAAKPDEAKVKDLVSAFTAGQDKLFASFKNQRDEELAQMSPVQQGKYLMAMGRWHQEMMAKGKKIESGKKK